MHEKTWEPFSISQSKRDNENLMGYGFHKPTYIALKEQQEEY